MISAFQRLPLSRKILFGIVPLFFLFISLSVALHNHFQEKEMMEQAQVSARTYAEIIKESLVTMMVTNYKVDESFLERVNELQQFDSLHILVNDLKLRKEIVNEEMSRRVETRRRTVVPHDSLEANVLHTGKPRFVRDGDHFRAIVPFNATQVCQKCHAVPIGYTLGATDLHVSLVRISLAAEGNWKRSLLIFVAFSIVAIAIATIMFTRYVSKPIDGLVEATRAISQGMLDYRIAETRPEYFAGGGNGDRSRDELIFLAQKFDEMRESLKEKIGQLDEVNTNLSARNREVEEALKQLRRAQEELVRSERLAVTGRMTAQLSHEINNPIHNIQSLLETSLRKVDGSPQAKELIGVALEEVTRMSKLTRQMLEFYRGSVMEFEKSAVDMRDLLFEIARSNEDALHKQHIGFVLDLPSFLPAVLGSRDKLKQVFLNLVINARDAMPGGGTLTIGARGAQGSVRIDVTDTGTGIAPEHLDRIFDAFFTTKKEVSGVGLGLSVSYGIIQQHNGSISVKSAVDKGTTFTIQLPSTGESHG